MDPNAALKAFTQAALAGRKYDANEYYTALRGWLERGGFEPLWGQDGLLTRKQFFQYNPSTGGFLCAGEEVLP
jgi:hypothetical protein